MGINYCTIKIIRNYSYNKKQEENKKVVVNLAKLHTASLSALSHGCVTVVKQV